ncbi:MAG: class I SAM-dependent methyltransferase [Desulfobacterales bacterium]|jgi:SAM-dependent methyltransferase
MNAPDSIDAVLGVEDLRAAFLSYTRHAYALLPAMGQPLFLDIGCGSGQATIELARLSGSSVVGIDTDATALSELRRRIEVDRLGQRIEIVNASLFDVSFADESFDLLWEEGVLHLLDSTRSLPVCRRLLKPGGFLVMHETVVWFESIRANLSADGFGIVNEYLLPKRCWWTDYYAPLEDRIRLLREERGREIASEKLAQYEREIAMVKANPDRFDCGFFILQKL